MTNIAGLWHALTPQGCWGPARVLLGNILDGLPKCKDRNQIALVRHQYVTYTKLLPKWASGTPLSTGMADTAGQRHALQLAFFAEIAGQARSQLVAVAETDTVNVTGSQVTDTVQTTSQQS